MYVILSGLPLHCELQDNQYVQSVLHGRDMLPLRSHKKQLALVPRMSAP